MEPVLPGASTAFQLPVSGGGSALSLMTRSCQAGGTSRHPGHGKSHRFEILAKQNVGVIAQLCGEGVSD